MDIHWSGKYIRELNTRNPRPPPPHPAFGGLACETSSACRSDDLWHENSSYTVIWSACCSLARPIIGERSEPTLYCCQSRFQIRIIGERSEPTLYCCQLRFQYFIYMCRKSIPLCACVIAKEPHKRFRLRATQ